MHSSLSSGDTIHTVTELEKLCPHPFVLGLNSSRHIHIYCLIDQTLGYIDDSENCNEVSSGTLFIVNVQ